MTEEPRPYVPADTTLPELTIKVLVLGVVLAVVLAGANAYLGLFAGLTVSASIPAAVISMAVLRLFRRSNILENNLVQTAASAGESLAAGVIFTIPAMLMLGAWTEFHYWDITLIAALGGVIGVMFTIPLRRAFIVERPLRFPEGVATAEVLKVGAAGGVGIKFLGLAGLIGVLFKFGSTGLRLWGELLEYARFAGGGILYLGTNLSPALVGVGYIVGLHIATLVFLGGALNWWVAIPIVAATLGVPVRLEFSILSLNPGLRQRCVAPGVWPPTNEVRSHASLKGHTPLTFAGGHTVARAELNNVRWVSHCRDLVQLPVAA